MSSDFEYASSPCMWHATGELQGRARGTDSEAPFDVGAWRRGERERQIRARLAVPPTRRAAIGARIASAVERAIGDSTRFAVSLYWPIRGEPDLRPLISRLAERNIVCALPVVVERGRPLVFRAWKPGDRLQRGIWNIPVPAAGREIEPDVILAPVVAFDRACYRLGYGGGFFDRTLAALAGRLRVFGVAYSTAEITTIHPQPHDLAMDAIVTEAELIER